MLNSGSKSKLYCFCRSISNGLFYCTDDYKLADLLLILPLLDLKSLSPLGLSLQFLPRSVLPLSTYRRLCLQVRAVLNEYLVPKSLGLEPIVTDSVCCSFLFCANQCQSALEIVFEKPTRIESHRTMPIVLSNSFAACPSHQVPFWGLGESEG